MEGVEEIPLRRMDPSRLRRRVEGLIVEFGGLLDEEGACTSWQRRPARSEAPTSSDLEDGAFVSIRGRVIRT